MTAVTVITVNKMKQVVFSLLFWVGGPPYETSRKQMIVINVRKLIRRSYFFLCVIR